jgi:ankyrin repeat protein
MAQVMLTAIENGKYYLIPNLLRLNSQGKNYLETNYFAENEREDLIFKMIDINRKDIVEFIISKDAHALTQTNQQGSNLLMYAINKDDKEIVELLLNKIPEANLGEVLTCVDRYYHRNALMIALFNNNEEMAKLIMSKIPEAKLEEALTCVDEGGRNALMLAVDQGDEQIAQILKSKYEALNLTPTP